MTVFDKTETAFDKTKAMFMVFNSGYLCNYSHNGSFCHPLGHPMAAGSTTGYVASRALTSLVKVLAGLIALSQ